MNKNAKVRNTSTKIADNFANKLSAQMTGLTDSQYVDFHDEGLANLDKLRVLAEKVKVSDVESFKKARELKSILGSLYCYAFNNDKESWRKVGEIEGIVGSKMLKFIRTWDRIRDKKVRAVAKYMITRWRYYYPHEDIEKMINLLLEAGKLYRNGDGQSYLVTGLHYSVGDNTFTYDRNGKLYRDYVRVCYPQAFWIKERLEKGIRRFEQETGQNIPVLDEVYEKTAVGDGKHLAKVYLSQEEHTLINREFVKNRF